MWQVNLAEGKMQAAMRQARGDAEAIRERAKAGGSVVKDLRHWSDFGQGS